VPELPEVQTLVNDLNAAGLAGVTFTGARVSWPRSIAAPGLRVLPAGRLLLRHLGMAFDAYLASAQAAQQRFSKAI